MTADAVTRSQLAEVLGALQAEAATKQDLAEFADLLEREMPNILAKVESVKRRVTWHFQIARDDAGLISDMVATTEDA